MSEKKVTESVQQKTKSSSRNKKQNKSKPKNEKSTDVMHIYRIKVKTNEASPEISNSENMTGS